MTTVLDDGRVEFRLYRPEAGHVNIAGDFSGWLPTVGMGRGSDGWWSALLDLLPGEYRFRYEVDGRWFTDFNSSGLEPSPFGLNSVLIVPEAKADGTHK
jgi:1,4-alpha-glucan branching enzyme